MHVHFIGIKGSGCSSIAKVAKKKGYLVTGCDLKEYKDIDLEEKYNIKVYREHSVEHINDADIVAASPAVIEKIDHISEVRYAKDCGKLISWQEFLGKNILPEYYSIGVAGTHGKTSTTALLGLTLESAKFDPTVIIGGSVNAWNSNARIGKSNYMVFEADEYSNNFLNYTPNVLLINNIEYEHPEFFNTAEEYKSLFNKFAAQLPHKSCLVANIDDDGVSELLSASEGVISRNQINVITYSQKASPKHFEYPLLSANIEKLDGSGILFNTTGFIEDNFHLHMFGKHNVSNALGVIAASNFLRIDVDYVKETFRNHVGVARRLQSVYCDDKVQIYNDYGHHPTEIKATLEAVKVHNSGKRIIAIVEPHMISRINKFHDQYVEALKITDRVVFTKIFLGREQDKELPDLLPIAKKIGIDKASVCNDFNSTSSFILNQNLDNSIVVIFGAGNSLDLTDQIVRGVKQENLSKRKFNP